jgi:C4-type Zn-finger protein
MNTINVTCPRCGSDRIKVEETSEIVFKCICKVSFVCENCGYRGTLKVYSEDGNGLEIVVGEDPFQ